MGGLSEWYLWSYEEFWSVESDFGAFWVSFCLVILKVLKECKKNERELLVVIEMSLFWRLFVNWSLVAREWWSWEFGGRWEKPILRVSESICLVFSIFPVLNDINIYSYVILLTLSPLSLDKYPFSYTKPNQQPHRNFSPHNVRWALVNFSPPLSSHSSLQIEEKSNTISSIIYDLSSPPKRFVLLSLSLERFSSLNCWSCPESTIITISYSLLFPVIIVYYQLDIEVQFMFLSLSLMIPHLNWKKCFGSS